MLVRSVVDDQVHDDPDASLIVNKKLCGDNAALSAVFGALLGASHGVEKFPDRWAQGLLEPPPELLSTRQLNSPFPAKGIGKSRKAFCPKKLFLRKI